MPYPYTNRKRIRGWPNMIRRLKQLELDHNSLDTWMLDSYGFCTFELNIAPFSNLTPRNPPGWYFREYVDSLQRVAAGWRTALEEEYENYYLAIWVYSPRESKTQLVAAVGERIKYYNDLFKSKEEDGSFPQSIQQMKRDHKWTVHWDYEPYWKDEEELDACDFVYLKKKSALEEKVGDDTHYLIPKGTVWINNKNPHKADLDNA